MSIATIKAAIEAKKLEIREKQAEIDLFEIEVSDSDYDDYLDEVNGEVKVCGMNYSASSVLKNVDPTAYRCGKIDYADSLDKEENEDYQELQSELEDLENELEDLETELEEAEENE